MVSGLPPIPEAEIEYQKIVRDKYRYQQEKVFISFFQDS